MAFSNITPLTTHRLVLNLLKADGPQTAKDLALKLTLTKMGVLRHLHNAQQEGLVEAVSEPKGRGRPIKIWKLTEKAAILFPDAHAELAVSLIDCMQRSLGSGAMARLLGERTREQTERYRQALRQARTLRERVEGLAEVRTREGYMAGVEWLGPKRAILFERNCPICTAAAACTGLCASELDVFQALLPGFRVKRTEHLVQGASRCAYEIRKG